MNIWGGLFFIVIGLWVFYEYLRYIKRKLLEIVATYNQMVELKLKMSKQIREMLLNEITIEQECEIEFSNKTKNLIKEALPKINKLRSLKAKEKVYDILVKDIAFLRVNKLKERYNKNDGDR